MGFTLRFAELLLCDYCPKAFHIDCHKPRLYDIPDGKWRCCECKAHMNKKRQRCGKCKDCLHPHCGECKSCKSLKKFGGDGKHGGSCRLRKCKFMRFADPPGPGWTPKRVKEYGQYVVHWISPKRQIEFRAHYAACEFERLRWEYDSDEFKAWEEFRKQCVGKRTLVVGAHQYDAHPKMGCVGPEWKSKRVTEYGQKVIHWISPTRKIEFRSLGMACKFDRLRSEFGSDEFKAWQQYRKYCADEGKKTRVVSPQDYDANPHRINIPRASQVSHGNAIASKTRNNNKSVGQQCQERRAHSSAKKCAIKKCTAKVPSAGRNATPNPANSPPGPGWEAKCVPYGQQVYTHWISPARRIEFRRRNPACNFEQLRREFGSDEMMAWKVFRQRYYSKGGKPAFVVSPQNYDALSKQRITEKKQLVPSVATDPTSVAHHEPDVQNYCDFDVGGGKDGIAHITLHCYLVLLTVWPIPGTCMESATFNSSLHSMVTVGNGGQHEEPRRSKCKRSSSKEILPRKRLRASATSRSRVALNSRGPFSTQRRGRGIPNLGSKIFGGQSSGNCATIAEQGQLAYAIDNVVIADHHDAEKEACESDELCYICDDGGGR